jgi:hypothetical protein
MALTPAHEVAHGVVFFKNSSTGETELCQTGPTFSKSRFMVNSFSLFIWMVVHIDFEEKNVLYYIPSVKG